MDLHFFLDYRKLILIVSVLVSFTVLIYTAIKGKRNKSTGLFVIFLLIIINMQLGELLIVCSGSTEKVWLFTQIKYFSVAFIGVSWTSFSLSLCKSKFNKYKAFQLILLIISIFLYIIAVTNNHHLLYFSRFSSSYRVFGIFFWINLIELYFCFIIGTYNIFKLYKDARKGKDIILLSLTAIIPILANALENFKIVSFNFDITTVVIPIPLLLVVYTLFYVRFFNVMPIALRKIYNNLDEGIVVIDSEHMVVSINKTFAELFPLDYFNYAIGEGIDIFLKSLGKSGPTSLNLNMLTDTETPFYDCELEINLPEKRVFSIKSCNSNRNSGKYMGKFIMFQDITVYKNLLLDIEEKNSELAASNEELTAINYQLNEHISIMEELTLYKERNRIAREVHDTLGHTLMLLISHIIISKNIVRQTPMESVEKLDEAIKIAQNALSEIRFSIKGLTSDENSPRNLVDSIERLVEYSSISGINIQVTVIGDEYLPPLSFSKNYCNIVETSTKICREAITNAMRHGKAKEISIIIKFIDQRIRLYIFDNGKGCTEIKKGLGITGMETRIAETGGTIIYGSDGESGFHIQAEIPVTFDTSEELL